MTEIKVQCDCGQKYKFDVEPVNGRMPYSVNCPLCGLDGTSKANEILRSMPASSEASFPAPPPPPPPLTSQPGRLRIGGSSGATAAPPTAAPPPAPRPFAGRPQTLNVTTIKEGNFTLGVLGAVAGGIVGMLAWYFIFKFTGLRLGFLAIGVGALTGYGSKWLGHHHSTSMGIVTGLCALLCIFGAQFMKAASLWHEDEKAVDQAYDEQVAEAKKIMVDVPNGTDDEIRKYLLKEMAKDGERPDSSQITAEEIKIYHDITWQRMSDYASGKITREHEREEARKLEEGVRDSLFGKIIFWVMALGIFNIFSIIIGVGVAYKVGIGEK